MPGVSGQGIFLSYRREDAGPYARSLQLQLGQRIPDTTIFMDLDSIEAGLDFAEIIEEAVASSAVLVALIGRQWATLTDEEGARRLDNPDDFVRFEIKTALERGVRVIPVLLDGARPLRQQELPGDLRRLARLNAHKLSYDRYQDDADRLFDLIERVLTEAGERAETAKVVEKADHKALDEANRKPRDEAELSGLEERARSAEQSGDAAIARDQLAALLPVRERVSGPEDPETLTIRRNLAYYTGVAGDAAAARDQLAALLPVRERVSGPEDPGTLAIRQQLAYWTKRARSGS
jgi:TIR domain/Tetratricopeptide repeat